MCRKIHFVSYIFQWTATLATTSITRWAGVSLVELGFTKSMLARTFAISVLWDRWPSWTIPPPVMTAFVSIISIYLSYNKMSPGHLTTTKLTPFIHHSDCLYPPHNEGVGGVYWFHSVRPSVPRLSRVRPASHVRSVAPTVLAGTISYLYILPSNFRCVACKVSCKISIFGICFKICNFDFVLFWLGIWCESLVWVIIERRGVSQNAGVLVVLVLLVFIRLHLQLHVLTVHKSCLVLLANAWIVQLVHTVRRAFKMYVWCAHPTSPPAVWALWP